jgi:hypothetical protein
MIIEVCPAFSPDDARQQARAAGYIVNDRLRAISMGMGFGEMDPGYILKVEKGEQMVAAENIRYRPDLEGVFDDLMEQGGEE